MSARPRPADHDPLRRAVQRMAKRARSPTSLNQAWTRRRPGARVLSGGPGELAEFAVDDGAAVTGGVFQAVPVVDRDDAAAVADRPGVAQRRPPSPGTRPDR